MSGDKGNFWTSVPGVLTGLASLVTAAIGLMTFLAPPTNREPPVLRIEQGTLERLEAMDRQMKEYRLQLASMQQTKASELHELDKRRNEVTAAIQREEARLKSLKERPAEAANVRSVDPTPLKAGQVWNGNYVCAQGVTSLSLRIVGIEDPAAVRRFSTSTTRRLGREASIVSKDATMPAAERLRWRPTSGSNSPPTT